jgi:hypothetical protein
MKTFGLFMLLFITTAMVVKLTIPGYSVGEIGIQSTLYAYIMQQYMTKKDNDN